MGEHDSGGAFHLYLRNRRLVLHPDGRVTFRCHRCKNALSLPFVTRTVSLAPISARTIASAG